MLGEVAVMIDERRSAFFPASGCLCVAVDFQPSLFSEWDFDCAAERLAELVGVYAPVVAVVLVRGQGNVPDLGIETFFVGDGALASVEVGEVRFALERARQPGPQVVYELASVPFAVEGEILFMAPLFGGGFDMPNGEA